MGSLFYAPASTSAAVISTFTFPQEPILPEPYIVSPRTVTHSTQSGMKHTYKVGETKRRWNIGFRLITATQMAALENVYQTATGDAGWFFWYKSENGFTAVAASSTTAHIDSLSTYNFVDEWRGEVIIITTKGAGGTPVGEIRRTTASTDLSPGTIFTVNKAWTIAPDTDNVFVWGYPVHIVDTIVRQRAAGTSLYDVDFVVEEFMLSETI